MDEKSGLFPMGCRLKSNGRILLSSLFMLVCTLLHAQSMKISGSVKSASDGEPLVGVSIEQRGASNGAVTDLEGNFTMNVEAGQRLVFSYVGFVSTEVTVKSGRSVYDVILKEDQKSLDEVVIMGYGVQQKKLVTGSTIQVKGEDIAKLNTVSAVGALASQSPGVQIVSNSGKPGAGYKVSIRGLGTMGDASPIVVIDGLVGGLDNLNNINPNDIESIDVLKDAASTAIYGARAANGVILVTTKKGKQGKAQITFDAYVGWQNIARKPQMLNAKEYATIMNEANINDGLAPFDFSSIVPDWAQIENGEWNGTNWVDEVIGKNAPQQNYSFGASGGMNQGNYSIGISYTSQEGVIGRNYFKSQYERYSARLNSEWVLVKRHDLDLLKFGENLQMNMTVNSGLGVQTDGPYNNNLRWAMEAFPFMKVYDDTGDWSKCIGSWSALRANPIARLYYDGKNNSGKNYSVRGNFYFILSPIKDLNIRTSFGYGYAGWTSRSFAEPYDLGGTFQRTADNTSQSSGNDYSWTWENTANYKFNVKGKHHFDTLIGMSVEKWGYGESVGASRQKSTFGDWKHAYISNTIQQEAVSTWSMWGTPSTQGRLLSYFGRVNYDYENTYMFTAILRADGSSNFKRGHRWGYFPSVSVGWNIMNESFMQGAKNWMDYLKLRTSWGQNGNCAISNFQYLSTINVGGADYYFGNDKTNKTTGSYPDILANEDITWETSEQIDLGIDARFLKSRLGLTFDWYQKTTKDWLVQAPILASYGTGAPYINGGDIRNTGVELGLTWNDHYGNDFSYGASLNLGYNKNEVTKLANGEGVINGSSDAISTQTDFITRVEVDHPIGFFYGYKTLGVFQNQDEVYAYKDKTGNVIMPSAQPGDVIFADVNGDGVISAEDRTQIGDPHPDVNLGLNLNASYKAFDISITGFGAFGQQIAHSYRDFGDNPKDNFTMDIAANRWHGEGTSNRYPRITISPHQNWKYISDIYVDNGDFFRISNITLGFDAKKIFTSIPLQQARFYISMSNLFTFTGYKGMDPEVGYGAYSSWSQGVDIGNYPSSRTFILGINIKY
ncbi:SusC/RagA family TonB-linked outer membrane protein [Prevotella sp. kh1p2]|uniref:SusC/RagA family TonB-linked outer membrane protein n=1 Tax=Prevotella sp. kh1p2 TaxID=1761883 RepID=UPI002101244C|nr:TonB-dependent receptor [Prevotella sp. kh1p2]